MDRLGTLLDRLVGDRPVDEHHGGSLPPPVHLLGLAVAVPVVLSALLRVAVNAPVALPPGIVGVASVADTAVLLVGGVTTLVVGLRTPSTVERVGLVAVGVFAWLAAVVQAAAIPATGVLVVGAAVTVGRRIQSVEGTNGRTVVAVGFVLALATALGSATGLLTTGFRSVGTWVTLLSLAGLTIVVRPRWPGWLLGGLAVAGVLYAGIVSPFLTGAVVLIGAGVVGTPLLLVAAGVGGAVAALTGAALAGNAPLALGGLLLLAAGVPATMPAAVAVVVGLVLLLHRPSGVSV